MAFQCLFTVTGTFGDKNYPVLGSSTVFFLTRRNHLIIIFKQDRKFLHAKTATAVVHLSHRNSVRPSVTWVNQSKTGQASITKSSPSAAWKTLVSGTVKLFHKFIKGHSE